MSDPLVFGSHDEATHHQIRQVIDSGASHYVQCADGHLGYGHPIGGVAAYKFHISLSGVGFDIGCGNLAVRTDLRSADVLPDIEPIMDDIVNQIAFGVGRTSDLETQDEYLFDNRRWDDPVVFRLKGLAKDQLGTVGSGNHYVDIFVEDATDLVWIGVHFGSRGFGHKVATHFMREVGAHDDMKSPPALIPVHSELGQSYINAMKLAGRYAFAGRNVVVDQVLRILGANSTYSVHNHHNFAWEETHFGEKFWVVRKGSTPAFPGQQGFVGGSMGDDAVIIEGVDSELSRQALYSTIHGAGRVMSRTAARGRFARDENGKKQRQPGLVRHDDWMQWMGDRGVCLRGGDLDEAPQAYRRLPEVLKAHEGTIKILHTLRPIGVAMAGKNVQDPYKD